MSRSVILSCAITGGGDTIQKSPAVPITPQQIATSAVEAAKAGAAVVHIHVRDPQSGLPSLDPELYREVYDRIRSSGADVIISLTTGEGGLVRSDGTAFGVGGLGTEIKPPAQRVAHVIALRPEMCSLDLGTLNLDNKQMINKPPHVLEMAKAIVDAEVCPEVEIFDVGNIEFAKHLIEGGKLVSPAFFQLCLGIPWGAPATPETMVLMRNLLPKGSLWAAFGIGPHEFPMLAQAVLLGGHVRVGLEDNLYLERGVLARSNAALVERGVKIIELLGERVATPKEAREILDLNKGVARDRARAATPNASA